MKNEKKTLNKSRKAKNNNSLYELMACGICGCSCPTNGINPSNRRVGQPGVESGYRSHFM